MQIAVFMGSLSDKATFAPAAEIFRKFKIDYTARVLSAHRVPEALETEIRELEKTGCEVFIAGAGLAAHLPGVIASKSIKPVIGVPIGAGTLGGIDALLSIAQMPKPIPVATVGLNNTANAAILAVEILALKYPDIHTALLEFREKMKEDYLRENGEVEL